MPAAQLSKEELALLCDSDAVEINSNQLLRQAWGSLENLKRMISWLPADSEARVRAEKEMEAARKVHEQLQVLAG